MPLTTLINKAPNPIRTRPQKSRNSNPTNIMIVVLYYIKQKKMNERSLPFTSSIFHSPSVIWARRSGGYFVPASSTCIKASPVWELKDFLLFLLGMSENGLGNGLVIVGRLLINYPIDISCGLICKICSGDVGHSP